MKNKIYTRYIESYQGWLKALNYEKTSITYGPGRIREFLERLEDQEINTIDQITEQAIQGYFKYLETRKNKRTGGVLSISTIRGYLRELRRFSQYLLETNQGQIDISLHIKNRDNLTLTRPIFTQKEINRLYQYCSDDLLGLRDRAMLSIYYGCGLRRAEGIQLEIRDIQFNRCLIHVRKGKNYKERQVPMVGRVMQDIRNYLEYSRCYLETPRSGNRLFIGQRGTQVQGQTMCLRIKKLKKSAGIKNLGSLHSLRHSIATHLLAAGMDIEQIARFLGHSTLESTQIYTHITKSST